MGIPGPSYRVGQSREDPRRHESPTYYCVKAIPACESYVYFTKRPNISDRLSPASEKLAPLCRPAGGGGEGGGGVGGGNEGPLLTVSAAAEKG
jgi:hypothetical protein